MTEYKEFTIEIDEQKFESAMSNNSLSGFEIRVGGHKVEPVTLEELDEFNDYHACYVQSETVCTDFIKQMPHDECEAGHIKLEAEQGGAKIPAIFLIDVLKFHPDALTKYAKRLGVRDSDDTA